MGKKHFSASQGQIIEWDVATKKSIYVGHSNNNVQNQNTKTITVIPDICLSFHSGSVMYPIPAVLFFYTALER